MCAQGTNVLGERLHEIERFVLADGMDLRVGMRRERRDIIDKNGVGGLDVDPRQRRPLFHIWNEEYVARDLERFELWDVEPSRHAENPRRGHGEVLQRIERDIKIEEIQRLGVAVDGDRSCPGREWDSGAHDIECVQCDGAGALYGLGDGHRRDPPQRQVPQSMQFIQSESDQCQRPPCSERDVTRFEHGKLRQECRAPRVGHAHGLKLMDVKMSKSLWIEVLQHHIWDAAHAERDPGQMRQQK